MIAQVNQCSGLFAIASANTHGSTISPRLLMTGLPSPFAKP
jgi:hypothetical protein